mmetsp:Transcript_34092/g.106738  ORF Transcript_34092/g.106738 Transcript_34092/m.106738 type:complete len:121 (-) Transcript_34092:72-434(-)
MGLFFGGGLLDALRLRVGKSIYERRKNDRPIQELQSLYERGSLTYNEYLDELASLKRKKILTLKEELKEEEPWWMTYLPVRKMTEEEIEMHAENCRRIELAKTHVDREKVRLSFEQSFKN